MSTPDPAPAIATEVVDGVSVVRMQAGENRFNPTMLAALGAALDELEGSDGPGALVLTGEGKFFSNGLDLDWMAQAAEGEPQAVVAGVHALLARVLAFPTVTVAAVNGHAFAAGGMLALACDVRVMRADRGYFCLPEVDLGLPFTPGMIALLRARLTPATANAAMVWGQRYGAPAAQTAGIVEDVAAQDDLLPAAIEAAAALRDKPRASVAAIKRGLYAEALAALVGPNQLG